MKSYLVSRLAGTKKVHAAPVTIIVIVVTIVIIVNIIICYQRTCDPAAEANT